MLKTTATHVIPSPSYPSSLSLAAVHQPVKQKLKINLNPSDDTVPVWVWQLTVKTCQKKFINNMSSVWEREACSKTELDMLSLKSSERKVLKRSKYELYVGEGDKYTCIIYWCVFVCEGKRARERVSEWNRNQMTNCVIKGKRKLNSLVTILSN